MSKNLVITHTDLDGAASYSILCWYKQSRIPVKPVSQADFKIFWKNSILNNISLFDKIYIFDLNVGDNFTSLDHPNVTIVDHHQESINVAKEFKNAKVYCDTSTSTSMLLYKTLKNIKQSEFLTKKQKYILLCADDYEQYSFRLPTTRDLNCVFWSYQGDRVSKFYEDFKDGFTSFTEQQKNLISFYNKRLKNTLADLKFFTTTIKVGSKSYKVASTFADFGINEVAEFVLKHIDSDVVIVVNLKTERVSFRKQKNCDVKLNKLANILAAGGGHEDAAGGILNDTFINFSKSFKEYEFQQHPSNRDRSPSEVLL
ncbi:MAG: hypothetical protein EB127_01515 [Alphaproteobacteria bacterium]|nr:hypothetical protein [Alphaproteobacteria bacterium]